MSFSAELFVADPEDAGLLLMHADPFTVWPHARLQGIHLIELVILYKLVCNVAQPEQLIADFLRLDAGIDVNSDTPEPLLLLMPPALQQKLSAHAEAALPALASRWTATDAANQLAEQEALAALQQLSLLSQQAEQESKSVLVLI